MSSRHCAFIPARKCPIDVDEIPLDVCRLCVDAWKTSAEIQTLTGANLLGPTIMVPAGVPQQAPYVPMAPMRSQPIPPVASDVAQQPITAIPSQEPDTGSMTREAFKMLQKLDAQFINDQLSAEDYVNMRKKLVDRLIIQRKANGERARVRATW